MTLAVVKVLERIINSIVIRHIEANNLLHSSQQSFCPGRSVDTNLLESYGHITKLCGTGVPAHMILLVFSKACHKQLAIKLDAIKLEGKSLLWILDFLYIQS